MGLWEIQFCTFYFQNWSHHLPCLSSFDLIFLLDIPISIPGTILHPRQRALELVHLSSLPSHSPALSSFCTISIADAVSELPDLLSPLLQFFTRLSHCASKGLYLRSPESCPETTRMLYSQCLGVYVTLGEPLANEWPVWKYESPVPLPSNKRLWGGGYAPEFPVWLALKLTLA